MANLSVVGSPTLQCVPTKDGKLLCEKAPEGATVKAPEQAKDELKLSRGLAPTLKGAGAGLLVGGAAGSLSSMAYNNAVGGWFTNAGAAQFGAVIGAASGAVVGAAVANLTDNAWAGAVAGAVTGFLGAGVLAQAGVVGGAAGAAAGVAGALVASRK